MCITLEALSSTCFSIQALSRAFFFGSDKQTNRSLIHSGQRKVPTALLLQIIFFSHRIKMQHHLLYKWSYPIFKKPQIFPAPAVGNYLICHRLIIWISLPQKKKMQGCFKVPLAVPFKRPGHALSTSPLNVFSPHLQLHSVQREILLKCLLFAWSEKSQ